MFAIDDQFLKDLGLDQLPDDQKQAFKEHIYSELEMRVGVRLSEGLTDAQLKEFESFVDKDESKVRTWVTQYAPDYQNDPAFVQIRQNVPPNTSEAIILAEYASLKWLGINRPNYREVVSQVLEELKQEIMSNRDAIVGGAQAAA